MPVNKARDAACFLWSPLSCFAKYQNHKPVTMIAPGVLNSANSLSRTSDRVGIVGHTTSLSKPYFPARRKS